MAEKTSQPGPIASCSSTLRQNVPFESVLRQVLEESDSDCESVDTLDEFRSESEADRAETDFDLSEGETTKADQTADRGVGDSGDGVGVNPLYFTDTDIMSTDSDSDVATRPIPMPKRRRNVPVAARGRARGGAGRGRGMPAANRARGRDLPHQKGLLG